MSPHAVSTPYKIVVRVFKGPKLGGKAFKVFKGPKKEGKALPPAKLCQISIGLMIT